MSPARAQVRIGTITKHILAEATGANHVNTQVLIASVPKGPLNVDHFKVQEAAPPAPECSARLEGEVLVQTLALTIGAGQRAGLQGSASYAGAAQANVLMNGTGFGRVVTSKDPNFTAGDLVVGGTGWQQQAALPGKTLTKASNGLLDGEPTFDGEPALDPETWLGALGTNGLTAYFGLLDVGAPQPGETVVVSAAAGSVGHIVGQIAKIQGCRVVGVAGSEQKCTSLVNELGFDAAVNYKSPTFRDDFKKATPKRIDIYFDNTGGDILSSALFRMNSKGRIICCGNASAYDTATPGGGPRGVPGLLVNNEVRMQGFLVFSYAKRYAEARAKLSEWIRSGLLKPRTTVYKGLENAPQAFVDLLSGATQGTTIVHVAD